MIGYGLLRSREEADKRDAFYEKTRFLVKVITWLGVCAQDFTMPVILEDGTIDAERYIEEVLPLAVKYGNKMLGQQWTYQQDDAKPHTIYRLTQNWCMHNFCRLYSEVALATRLTGSLSFRLQFMD